MTVREPAAGPPGPSRRDAAVARSIDPARVRVEKRLQRFLDAALELVSGADGRDFTVQEVVERSGQSLRSFYQNFGGKHELLLALFEESVRASAEHLRSLIADETDPLARLRLFTIEYYVLCAPLPGDPPVPKAAPAGAIAEFAQRLLTEHPKEAARAYLPLVVLVEELLVGATAVGSVRAGTDRRRLAGTVLSMIMFNQFSMTIGSAGAAAAAHERVAAAEELWQLLLTGIATNGPNGRRGEPDRM